MTQHKTTRHRAWLRGFLNLGALQQVERISDAAIRLQEDTVLAALDILDREPGVLLADEVGMGKTFQALGVIAARFEAERLAGRTPRVLVVTPAAALNKQWVHAAKNFAEKGFYGGFPRGAFGEVTHITALPAATKHHAVVFAPVTVFTSARGHAERGFLLDLWFRARGLHGNTRKAIRQRIEDAGVVVTEGEKFLGLQAEDLVDLPDAAFKGARGGHAGLDDLYEGGDLNTFRSAWSVKKALDRVRFQVVKSVLPDFDLLVVDEAHKLKNPWTVQSQAVAQVLGGTFRRAVFLTATPFQLGVTELRRVFEMFGYAENVRDGFKDDVDALFADIADYQRTYDTFEAGWRFADIGHASGFSAWATAVAAHPVDPSPSAPVPGLDGIDDPNVVRLAREAWALRRLKEHGVEPGFRRWTVRSLKPEKRARRRDHALTIRPEESAMPVLLLYQRLMTARARSGARSHVEAAETGIASSFAAAREGAMAKELGATAEAEAYGALVRDLLTAAGDQHPKVIHVLDSAMAAADRWEKSLIFCERNATIDSLQSAIEARWMGRLLTRWQRLYPQADEVGVFGAGSGDERTVGVFQRWAGRFTRGQDQLSVALREAYPYTLFVPPDEHTLPEALWADLPALLADANEVLRAQRSGPTHAARLDYRIARRCVDVAVARWFERHRPEALLANGGLAGNLLHPAYPRLGIDLVEDEEERDLAGAADTEIRWTLSEEVLRTLLDPTRPSIWFPFREKLARSNPTERGAIVEAVRTFLTRRQVPFLIELVERAGGAEASSASVRDTLERWWVAPDCVWPKRIEELLDYLPRIGEAERMAVLGEALKSGEFVARGNQSEQRQRIQDAFNTSFFPMILVGNRTMQEGLNLHRQCRRVVHHDLRWNPADIEQRVGRVDRHGSLAERRLAATRWQDGHILIGTPLLARTIDPPRYRRVKEREKWLEFLLGAAPSVGHGSLDSQELAPLPQALTEGLRIRLGPWPAPEDGGQAAPQGPNPSSGGAANHGHGAVR